LALLQKKVKEMEEEDAKLRAMQAELDNSGGGGANGNYSFNCSFFNFFL
jgi:hypothetical protein